MEQYPIGLWNSLDLDSLDPGDVDDWKDLGMTLAISPKYDFERHDGKKMREILDRAHVKGMKVFVRDKKSEWGGVRKGEEAYRRGFEGALEEFGSHPGVMGFYIGDEPDRHTMEDACMAYRIQREMAPELAPFLNLLPWYVKIGELFGIAEGEEDRFVPVSGIEERTGYPDFRQYLEGYISQAGPAFLMYDCYSQMLPGEKGLDMYFNNLREYGSAALRHGIPFWTALLSIGHFMYECPCEDDLRWQLNTAAAHGAAGIVWYYIYQQKTRSNYRIAPIDEHCEKTETYGWMRRVNKSFLKGNGPTVKRLRLKKVMHAGKAYGGNSVFSEDGLVLDVKSFLKTPMIVSEFKDEKENDYVMVVNNSRKDSTLAALVLRRPTGRVELIGWENRALPAEQECYSCVKEEGYVSLVEWFAPGQMYLYKIDRRKI